jgi:hypothetical protein
MENVSINCHKRGCAYSVGIQLHAHLKVIVTRY